MEFVDGHSCAELLRDRGPMAPRDAVEILTQACRGLDYAHRNGVVHRDVKPGNLMVNTDGVVKLADFGIAKAAEQSDITKVGSVLGTAAYLSPEQARGEPAGPASDLYALGVVSYQLMAGQAALRGGVADRSRAAAGGRPAAAAGRRRARRAAGAGRRRRPRAGARPGAPLRRTRPRWRTRCATASPASAAPRISSATRALPRRGRDADAHRRPTAPPAPAPAAAAGRRAARAARPRAARPPPPPRSESGGAGKWIALVLVILLLAAAATPTTRSAARRTKPQLNEDVGGTVDERRRQLQAARRGQHALAKGDLAPLGSGDEDRHRELVAGGGAVGLGEAGELRGARAARRCACSSRAAVRTVPPRMPSQSASSESTWSVVRDRR